MSILADLSNLVHEVREMLVALRDLARDMRDPAPKPHPLDASPLPTPEEAFKGADEEAREWAKMQEQVAEWLKTPPESSAVPVVLPSAPPTDTHGAHVPVSPPAP